MYNFDVLNFVEMFFTALHMNILGKYFSCIYQKVMSNIVKL